MTNVKIILSVIIVLLIGVAAASYEITNNTPGLWTPLQSPGYDASPTDTGTGSSSGSSQSSSGSSYSTGQSSGSGGAGNTITPAKAKEIAQGYINDPEASAGTPKLLTVNGQQIYVVPIERNGAQVGEIYIDPETGKNLGGAGGVSYG